MSLHYSRRDFLRTASTAGVLVAGGSALAACTRRSTEGAEAPGPSATATPRQGGTLRIGMVGSGNAETFNPGDATQTSINVARTSSVFDTLVAAGPELAMQPALATSWTPNADSSEWTFTLRDGVTWHDGSPLTPDDVIYSIRWSADTALAASVAAVDLGRLRADGNTVVVPLNAPGLLFPQSLSNIWIIKNGTTDFTRPIGTGPFVFDTFTPGQRSVGKRNPTYWDAPRPYVDELVIQSIDDDTARVNALLGDQIDAMSDMPFAQAKAQQSSGQITVLSATGPTAQAFYMAVDQPPFDDVRVRQAIRLLADRQQLVDVALDGYGTVANDLFGKGLEFYDSSLAQRTQDITKAKQLLAAAGHPDGLTLDLQTSAVTSGMVEAATLFAQQATLGGVTINVSNVNPGSYFDPTTLYLKMPFAQSIWAGFTTLSDFYQYALMPGSAGNETHWSDPATERAIAKAANATTMDEAAAAWQEVQQQQYDDGGYLWWANVNNVDACSKKVAGITPNGLYPLGLPGSLTTAYFAS